MSAFESKQELIDFLNVLEKIPVDLDRSKITNALKETNVWPLYYEWGQPSCEIIIQNDTRFEKMHSELYENNEFNHKLVQDLYNQGYTLLLSNVGDKFKELYEFQSVLDEFFCKKININLYAGMGTKSVSFLNHSHPYGVIVRNVLGKSVWVFNHNEEVILDKNRVVYFEPNVYHYVKQIFDDKITLTCNLD
jgi:hypothetical protein